MPEPSEDLSGARPHEPNPYRHLPDPIRLEDTITSQDSEPPPDPRAGRNTEQEFVLRYA